MASTRNRWNTRVHMNIYADPLQTSFSVQSCGLGWILGPVQLIWCRKLSDNLHTTRENVLLQSKLATIPSAVATAQRTLATVQSAAATTLYLRHRESFDECFHGNNVSSGMRTMTSNRASFKGNYKLFEHYKVYSNSSSRNSKRYSET